MNNPIMQMFMNFMAPMMQRGFNPVQMAQQMANSGQMTPDQYNIFQQIYQSSMNSGFNPEQMVQQLLNSGRMTQEQFNQFSAIANRVSGRRM